MHADLSFQERGSRWRALRLRGLIPGPQESEALFMRRVERSPAVAMAPPINLSGSFQVIPDWVQVDPHSAELRVWEGAATLIDEDADGVHQARILLGKSLFLTSQELLVHEAIHAIRCAFPDSPLEEVMAWHTCPRRWQRHLAGLSLDLAQLVLLFLSWQAAMLGWLLEHPLWYFGSAVGFGLALLRAHTACRPLEQAISHLRRQGLPTWPILLHLSPDEIIRLGRCSEGFWNTFAKESHFRFEFMQATFAMLRSK